MDMHNILREFEFGKVRPLIMPLAALDTKPNFISDPTKLISSQTLAYIQLRVCLKY